MKILENEKIERGNTKIAVKAGFWYVVSTFLTKGLAFITTPIFARLMSEAHYGEFSNYANWQSILIIIVSLEMYNTLSRAYYDYTDDYDKYVSSITIATCGVTLLFYILFLICGDWIYNVIAIPQQFVHILFFTMMFQSCKTVFLTRERTLYRYKSATVLSMLSLVVPTLISVFLVISVPESERLSARIYGFYIPYALLGVYCAAVLIYKGRTFKWSHFKYAVKLAIPLLVHYLTTYMLTVTNTIITKNFLGAEAAAVVSITVSIMNIITMLFQAVTGALTTWVMDKLEQHEFGQVRKCGLLFAAVLGCVTIGVMLLAPEVVWIMGGSKYVDAISLIPGLAFSIFFQVVTTLFTIILTFNKSVTETSVVTAVVAILSIVAKILLISQFGYEILPFINLAAFAVLFFANYLIVRKKGYGSCINFKGMLAIAAVVGVFCALSYVLYENIIIRYGIIAVFIVAAVAVIIKTRNIWMKLLRKKKSS